MEDIYSLFVQATRIPDAERAAWVESLDLTDEARAELNQLVGDLDGYQPGKTKVRTLILGTVQDGIPQPVDRVGKVIGPYRLERLVVDAQGRSAGNMGHVYEARRIDGAFDQTVAVKIIQYLRDDAGGRERFIRERRYLGTLRHPNIVRILDAGAVGWESLEDPQPYFIMEWVEDGLDIVSYIRVRNLSIQAALKLFAQVCDGVAFAHSQGVVHRDLKPQNVLVGRDGVPRLLDFGISSALPEAADPAILSEDHGLLRSAMTLAYASPEQLAKQPVGPASDIYSLGVILYEILAGKRPYEMSGDWERDSRFIAEVTIPRIPGVGFDPQHIVQKALQKDLAARYRHVDQLAGDIRRYLGGVPVRASLNSLGRIWGPGYWLLRHAQKNIRLLVAAFLLIGLVLLTTAYFGSKELVGLYQRFNGGRIAAEAVLAAQRGDYPLAATLAGEAAIREQSFAARSVLQQSLPHLPRRIFHDILPFAARLVAYTPDRSKFVLLLQNGDLEVRSVETGERVSRIAARQPIKWRGASPCASFSSDGGIFAALLPGQGVMFDDLSAGQEVYFYPLPGISAAEKDIDCASPQGGAGLTWRSNRDWKLLLHVSGDQYLSVSQNGGVNALTSALGCDSERFRCLFRVPEGLELRRLGPPEEVLMKFRDARDGALSERGLKIALLREDRQIAVASLSADGRDRSPWELYSSRSNGVLLFQSSGSRLLIDEPGGRRIQTISDGTSGSYLRERGSIAALDPVSFFLFEHPADDLLSVRITPESDPYRIPVEGPVAARASDDVTGTLMVADRGGFGLSVWRLPVWPGGPGEERSAIDLTAGHLHAAGWTHSGELVLYSPLDGTVERLLEPASPYSGLEPLPLRVWFLNGGKWLLTERGREISLRELPRSTVGATVYAEPNAGLVIDPSARWMAVTSLAPGNDGTPSSATLYQIPSLRPVAHFPSAGVLGLTRGRNSSELAVLLASGSSRRPKYQIVFYTVEPFGFQQRINVNDPDRASWDWLDVRAPIGFECVGAPSGPLTFTLEHGVSGRPAECYSIRVDVSNLSVTFVKAHGDGLRANGWTAEHSSTLRAGTQLLEVRANDGTQLASELISTDLSSSPVPAPGGLALRKEGSWHRIFFGFSDLIRETCAHAISPVPPALQERYDISGASSSCSSDLARGSPNHSYP